MQSLVFRLVAFEFVSEKKEVFLFLIFFLFNRYQTARAVEANSLRLPVGIMLLQKSKPHAVAANRERELSTRLGNDTL